MRSLMVVNWDGFAKVEKFEQADCKTADEQNEHVSHINIKNSYIHLLLFTYFYASRIIRRTNRMNVYN
jgi:hypothetical protein